MKVLLDTHIALWAAEGASQLSAIATDLIEQPDNTFLVCATAIWEIAIKHAKGSLPRSSKRRANSLSSGWICGIAAYGRLHRSGGAIADLRGSCGPL
jgi:hypothetical protein